MVSSDLINALPKLDLHCHLDGSFSSKFIKNTLNLANTTDDLDNMLKAPESCSSLTDYLKCFDLPISAIQTKNNIINGVLDVLEQAVLENVKYIELRFAPTCSINENLRLDDILQASMEGCKIGKNKFDIDSNIIVCAMRHHDYETNSKLLDVMADYIGYGICAFDIAGDESKFPNQAFIDLFKKAKNMNIPFTIHSGECGSVDNVRLAMDFGASRIGHGIALIKDMQLLSDIKKQRIGLELCPTSNFQTRACQDYSSYPLNIFLKNGLLATINTDNRTVSNTNMTKELTLAINKLNIREEDLLTVCKNSIEISFANDNIKHRLLCQLNSL